MQSKLLQQLYIYVKHQQFSEQFLVKVKFLLPKALVKLFLSNLWTVSRQSFNCSITLNLITVNALLHSMRTVNNPFFYRISLEHRFILKTENRMVLFLGRTAVHPNQNHSLLQFHGPISILKTEERMVLFSGQQVHACMSSSMKHIILLPNFHGYVFILKTVWTRVLFSGHASRIIGCHNSWTYFSVFLEKQAKMYRNMWMIWPKIEKRRPWPSFR